MSSEFIAIIAVAIALVLAVSWLIVKDKENREKLRKFELVLEGLIKENYRLKKELAEQQGEKAPEFDTAGLYANLDSKIQNDINAKIIPIIASVQSIQSAIEDFANEQQGRLWTLEERTKSISQITPKSISEEGDEQIIAAFKAGKSVESIARDLRLGVGRVNMVLRMHELI